MTARLTANGTFKSGQSVPIPGLPRPSEPARVLGLDEEAPAVAKELTEEIEGDKR